MPDPLIHPQQFLQELYGVLLPDDFFHFWQFANEISPDDPFNLPINLTLVGSFEVLAGEIEPTHSTASLRMHWRFYKDPPEFFTILCGDGDGLHFGYYYDDLNSLPGCVCRYFHNDAYLLANAGTTVFNAVRQYVIEQIAEITEWVELNGYIPKEEQEELDRLQQFLEQLQDYTNRHSLSAQPERRTTAETWDGMGIVVPPNTYRPLTEIHKIDQLVEAQTALDEGFPGTALKLAKDLWSLHDPEWEPHAIALMRSAYPALNRPLLAETLREHLATRDPALAFVDLKMDIWKLQPVPDTPTLHLISSLTPVQTEQIATTLSDWKAIALATQPINPNEAITAVTAIYRVLERTPPRIEVLPSPQAAWVFLAETLNEETLTPIASHLWQQVRSLHTLFENQVDPTLLNTLTIQLSSALWKQTNALQSALTGYFLKSEQQLLFDRYKDSRIHPEILACQVSLFDFCSRVLNLDFDQNWLMVLQNLVVDSGLILAFEELCLICDRPRTLWIDKAGRIQAYNEPAIIYADGFQIHQ